MLSIVLMGLFLCQEPLALSQTRASAAGLAEEIASKFSRRKRQVDSLSSIDWHWSDIGGGMQKGYFEGDLLGNPHFICIVRYPMSSFKTDIIVRNGSEATATSYIGSSEGAKAAINGNFFDRLHYSVSIIRDEGATPALSKKWDHSNVNGMLLIRDDKGQKLSIDFYGGGLLPKGYREGITAGPLLVKDGNAVSYPKRSGAFYRARHPRSIIGISYDGMVYMIVIDGRFPGRAAGATIMESAAIARSLGLKDALNLDGGGSSTLWTSKDGVLNHPSDNRIYDHRGERRVPNAIVARQLL